MPAIPPRRRLLVALAGAALVAAPAPSLAKAKSAGKPAARTYVIEMRNMAFGPQPASVRVGDVIEWVNNDIFRHSATARDGSFNVDLPPRKSARTVVAKPGQVAFYCRYHPGMTGRLTVVK